MIAYPIRLRDLCRDVDAALPTTRNKDGTIRKNGRLAWRVRAGMETNQLRGIRTYEKSAEGEFWNELKPVFDLIQKGKCAYCESCLDRHRNGLVVGDLDHYRPKNGVIEWSSPYKIPTGRESEDCYYLLAFHLGNYILSCDTCNRGFKQNYFPIAGNRCSPHSSRPRRLREEQPYLIHPLAPNEQAPEQLIGFKGIVPEPRSPEGSPDYWRARVTIDLLGLNAAKRLKLSLERARVVRELFLALRNPDDPDAAEVIAEADNDALPHRNCARSYLRLHTDDPIEAEKQGRSAMAFLRQYDGPSILRRS